MGGGGALNVIINPMESQELLRSAVLAARSGQRPAARALFLQVTQRDPNCELAWLWLSDLHDDLVERIRALEKAQNFRPDNPHIQARLAQLRAEASGQLPDAPIHPPILIQQPQRISVGDLAGQPFTNVDESPAAVAGAKAGAAAELGWRNPQPAVEELDVYHQAERLAKAGKRDSALGLLHQLVEVHDQRADAWLLIAQLAPGIPEKIAALKKVILLQPNHSQARARLKRLENLERNPLLLGAQHEERGEREQAALVYQWIAVHSRTATDRLEANRRSANLALLQEAERLHPVNSTLNLLRLTLGPALFFALLLFIQSGLNPFKMSILSLLGEASVLTGSLLVNVTGLRPKHPRWVQYFGRPGTGNELEMRFSLRLLGWGLLVAPYVLFVIEALHRIALFRTTLDF